MEDKTLTLTNDELCLLADALLAAIARECEAEKLTSSCNAKERIEAKIGLFRYMNKKICDLMD